MTRKLNAYSRYKTVFYFLPLLFFYTCKTPYTPAPITNTTNYLVVEGLINLTDSTYINLSRTVNLSTATTSKPELKATVTIESSAGTSYPLKELGKGVYIAVPLNLPSSNQYRLHIKTANGSTYVSDFGPTMVSPPIDSINWRASGNTLNIYATTHDPQNATRYYRWDYSEEWEFNSDYDSNWISNGISIVSRAPTQLINHCYGGDTSHLITLGTSASLAQDVISRQNITTISSDAEKLGVRYSILVKQYALTKDAYDYWTLLKKNTEQLGSIFDSQPSASIGNLHNVNVSTEPVIGYISAGTVTSQRIFIAKSQLPTNWITTAAYPVATICKLETVAYCVPLKTAPFCLYQQNYYLNYKSQEFLGNSFQLIPVKPISVDPSNPNPNPDYLSASPICVDCTLRGSVNKPAYW